jgi:hypothetical protein
MMFSELGKKYFYVEDTEWGTIHFTPEPETKTAAPAKKNTQGNQFGKFDIL